MPRGHRPCAFSSDTEEDSDLDPDDSITTSKKEIDRRLEQRLQCLEQHYKELLDKYVDILDKYNKLYYSPGFPGAVEAEANYQQLSNQ